jgi:hypothetical protein
LSILISILVLLSTLFFLFTISYKYSLVKKEKEFDKIIVHNSLKEAKIFNLERKSYKKQINKKLVFADKVKYLKVSENFAFNYSNK